MDSKSLERLPIRVESPESRHPSGRSTSLLSVRGMLIATIPSDSGDATISTLQDQILHELERTRSRGLILDISLVETMDSYFARVVQETAAMVTLSGGSTVISGMRPSVAITATELGIGFEGVRTALNVERALDQLEGLVSA